jgi:hypothetical protein
VRFRVWNISSFVILTAAYSIQPYFVLLEYIDPIGIVTSDAKRFRSEGAAGPPSARGGCALPRVCVFRSKTTVASPTSDQTADEGGPDLQVAR